MAIITLEITEAEAVANIEIIENQILKNIISVDGGGSSSIYLINQIIDGGSSNI